VLGITTTQTRTHRPAVDTTFQGINQSSESGTTRRCIPWHDGKYTVARSRTDPDCVTRFLQHQ